MDFSFHTLSQKLGHEGRMEQPLPALPGLAALGLVRGSILQISTAADFKTPLRTGGTESLMDCSRTAELRQTLKITVSASPTCMSHVALTFGCGFTLGSAPGCHLLLGRGPVPCVLPHLADNRWAKSQVPRVQAFP